MIYTSREKLTCFCLEDGNDEVEIWQFNSLLMENPANVIYGEKLGDCMALSVWGIFIGHMRQEKIM